MFSFVTKTLKFSSLQISLKSINHFQNLEKDLRDTLLFSSCDVIDDWAIPRGTFGSQWRVSAYMNTFLFTIL